MNVNIWTKYVKRNYRPDLIWKLMGKFSPTAVNPSILHFVPAEMREKGWTDTHTAYE